ncbi:MAG: hypothetical protein EOP05_22070, partial [Proteobacteria bacterium]
MISKFLTIALTSILLLNSEMSFANYSNDSFTIGPESQSYDPKNPDNMFVRFYGCADGVVAEVIDTLRKAKRPTSSQAGWETFLGPDMKVVTGLPSMELSVKPSELFEAAAGNRADITRVYNLVHFGGPAAKFLTDSMELAGAKR